MELLFGPIIGFTQGVTELLPISSSGHIILVSYIYGREPSITILTLLHLASAIALTLLYWDDLMKILKSSERNNFLINVAIASVPVVLLGVGLGDQIDQYLYFPAIIAISLIFWGLIMIVTEHYEEKFLIGKGLEIQRKNAVIIGLFQMLSLIPGTSRSGISTMAGVWSGVRKDKALDFSFMMGIPLLYGAFFFSFISKDEDPGGVLDFENVLAFTTTFLVSYLVALLLRRYSRSRFLTLFGVYRIFLGIFIFLLIL